MDARLLVGSIIPVVVSGSRLFGMARDLLRETAKKVVSTSILSRYALQALFIPFNYNYVTLYIVNRHDKSYIFQNVKSFGYWESLLCLSLSQGDIYTNMSHYKVISCFA